jgi:hypothetical protein
MESWQEPDASDSAVIMGALFDINVQLEEIGLNVVAIRRLLEDDGEQEDHPQR